MKDLNLKKVGIEMKSLKFSCAHRSSDSFVEARQRMEKSANNLRRDNCRVVSVLYIKETWFLFYEPNVSEPAIKKTIGALSSKNKFYPLGDPK